ncbi:MAG: epsG [Rhodocyclales bacterium]|nr:epsG [Rhodocyclales bacterium]
MHISSLPREVTSRQLNERAIGAILIDSDRLRPPDAERILRLQREKGMRFGEAGLALGVLTQADIDFAISRQFDYAYLAADDTSVSREVVAAFQPFTPLVEQLRVLRSQLMLRWLTGEPQRKTIVVASPQRGDGRSYVAANLAVVFSQLGERTLLIDADLRNASQHRYFKLDNRVGLVNALTGRTGEEIARPIPGLRDLSVMTSGALPPNPQELLAKAQFGQLLESVSNSYDIVIVDTSAGTVAADVELVAARAGAAMIVARKNHTSAASARDLVERLTRNKIQIPGSVLNSL